MEQNNKPDLTSKGPLWYNKGMDIKKQWAKNLSEQEQFELFKARHERDNANARERAHRDRLKTAARKYKTTEEELNRILDETGGICQICGNGLGERLNIDHDHVTLIVRGILCGNCNNGLGQFQDSPGLLRKAADYLDSFA
jgi:hypothetical protein